MEGYNGVGIRDTVLKTTLAMNNTQRLRSSCFKNIDLTKYEGFWWRRRHWKSFMDFQVDIFMFQCVLKRFHGIRRATFIWNNSSSVFQNLTLILIVWTPQSNGCDRRRFAWKHVEGRHYVLTHDTCLAVLKYVVKMSQITKNVTIIHLGNTPLFIKSKQIISQLSLPSLS